jgi:hypothetical protein
MADMELYADASTVRCVLKNDKGEVIFATFIDAKMFTAAKHEDCSCVFQTVKTDGKEEATRISMSVSSSMVGLVGAVYPAVIAKLARTKLDVNEVIELGASHKMSIKCVEEELNRSFQEATLAQWSKKGGDDK